MKRNSSVLKVTGVILNIVLVLFLLMFAAGLLTAILNPDYINNHLSQTLNILLRLVGGAIIIYIFIALKQIVRTVSNGDAFCYANIKRFRTIGCSIFALGMVYTAVTFPLNTDGGLISTPYGGIDAIVLIYILLGCLALLLSEIFAQGLEIKEENEMTI